MSTGLALIVGFGAGWSLQAGVGKVAPSSSSSSAKAEPGALEACEEKLAAANALLDAHVLEEYGVPEPWPEDWPAEYSDPELYRRNAEAAIEACGLEGFDLRSVDCDEPPCIAWFLLTGPDNTWPLKECEAWKATYRKSSVSSCSGSFLAGGDSVRYGCLGEVPLGESLSENGTKRVGVRFDQGRARLVAGLGGRELTPREKWDQQIAFWRERAKEDPSAARLLEILLADGPPEDEGE